MQVGIKPEARRTVGTDQACSDTTLTKGALLRFPGSCGVQVFIDRNNDGVLQLGDEPSTITDHLGRFAFAEPGPKGVKQVTVTIPQGFLSREDYGVRFERYHKRELKGSTQKGQNVSSLEACQALCHPVDPDAQPNRHEVRNDSKECGGILYDAQGDSPQCTLIITNESERILSPLKRPTRANLYVRHKQSLRSIQRLINVDKRPVVLPRVILHPKAP